LECLVVCLTVLLRVSQSSRGIPQVAIQLYVHDLWCRRKVCMWGKASEFSVCDQGSLVRLCTITSLRLQWLQSINQSTNQSINWFICMAARKLE